MLACLWLMTNKLILIKSAEWDNDYTDSYSPKAYALYICVDRIIASALDRCLSLKVLVLITCRKSNVFITVSQTFINRREFTYNLSLLAGVNV